MFVKIGNRLGFDKAIKINLVKGLWLATSSLITIIIVTKFLDPLQQGYYFTIYGLIGLQVFVEMGLGFALVQIISHEMGALKILKSGVLDGDERSKANIKSIIVFSIKWFFWGGLLLFIIMVISGLYIFNNKENNEIINIWIILSLIISLNIQVNTVNIFLEGVGRVEELAKFKIMQTIFSTPILWVLLIYNNNLYAILWASIASLTITVLVAYFNYSESIKNLLSYKSNHHGLNWKKEILPFQTKIAISWLSGYLMLNALTPMIFKSVGAIEAGRFGATIQLFSLINSGASVWITTKMPHFGRLISLNRIDELKVIFKRSLKQSTLILITLLVLISILYYILTLFDGEILERFISLPGLMLLILSCIANHFTLSMAYYLRSFKDEPLMYLSIFNGLTTFTVAILLTPKYGSLGAAIGISFGSIFIGLLFGFIIFKNKYEK
jgi:O-antigen/teichoic acid export membrane protein